jgi:hypothetical protein
MSAPARRRIVAAALALTASIALADCDDPAPEFARPIPSTAIAGPVTR